MKKYFWNLLLIVVIFFSCRQIITLNLQSTPSQLVVEALLSDSDNSITLTRSLNFYDTSSFSNVDGATVYILNSQSDTFYFKQDSLGIYKNSILKGIPRQTYFLYIQSNNQTVTASCTMPDKVNLDSILITKLSFITSVSYFIQPKYTDPDTPGNYYQFRFQKNDSISNAIIVRNDNTNNGGDNAQPIGSVDSLKLGDTINVELRSITKPVFVYLNGLNATKNSQIQPANPISNLRTNQGYVFGYFNAYPSSKKTLIYKPPPK